MDSRLSCQVDFPRILHVAASFLDCCKELFTVVVIIFCVGQVLVLDSMLAASSVLRRHAVPSQRLVFGQNLVNFTAETVV